MRRSSFWQDDLKEAALSCHQLQRCELEVDSLTTSSTPYVQVLRLHRVRFEASCSETWWIQSSRQAGTVRRRLAFSPSGTVSYRQLDAGFGPRPIKRNSSRYFVTMSGSDRRELYCASVLPYSKCGGCCIPSLPTLVGQYD